MATQTDSGVTWPPPPNWRAWRHVTKLDPERPLSDGALETVLRSGTDALLIGGSSGVTFDAVLTLLSRVQGAPLQGAPAARPLPVALEVSTLESAMPGPDLFLIPLVLNTPHTEWQGGAQARALAPLLERFGPLIPWELLLPEAYLVLNPAATAARVTGALPLETRAAAAYAAFAGRILRLPLLYVEYSGTFGDMELLQAVRESKGPAHLLYGGGIASAAQAARAGALADTVVVGNLVYQEPSLLRETVAAVKAG